MGRDSIYVKYKCATPLAIVNSGHRQKINEGISKAILISDESGAAVIKGPYDAEISDHVQQFSKAKTNIAKDVMEVKEARSGYGSQYRRFSVKRLGKTTSGTWIVEETLQRADQEIYA
ncbi:hypothetical protein V6N12_021022 [Hibiscus sabdariffa]|uniref:Uncharacterized protein n=1 Tax=Hibiscus sabdariffa TaxID=183260 RepID=A0ABR2B238_9ROSI